MLSNMACSLIEHKRITTTVAKAKALKVYVEPLITRSKTDSTHSRRMVFSNLKSKDAVSTLFREVAPKVADRPGGYTRIIRLGNRLGDAAEMCMIELVDFNEIMLQESKSKTRRSRRGGKKKSGESQGPAASATSTSDSQSPAAEATTATSATSAATVEPEAATTPEAAVAEASPAAPPTESKDEAADEKAPEAAAPKKEAAEEKPAEEPKAPKAPEASADADDAGADEKKDEDEKDKGAS